jgi:hypothetical protein
MNKNDFLTTPKSQLVETRILSYVTGYKYQARNDMVYQTFVYPEEDIITPPVVLRTDGWMWVSAYFAWDGCSGPTWDDKTNMRGGQCHDALYYLFRIGLLPISWRCPAADANLSRLMRKDGAWHVRAEYYEWAVNKFGEKAATEQRKVHYAPSNPEKEAT